MPQPSYTHQFTVEHKHTADVLGNEGVQVLGTPFLLLFLELTSQYHIEEIEGKGTVSVGISADFKHLEATPVGCTVTVESTLVEHDRRRYKFEVIAKDEAGLVGEGRHERFRIDDLEKFLAKSNERHRTTCD